MSGEGRGMIKGRGQRHALWRGDGQGRGQELEYGKNKETTAKTRSDIGP